jgi:SAM-dependent methyltransferase
MDYLQGQVFDSYSDYNLERLLGNKPEKESSKAVLELIESEIKNGDKILEVGCSVGHLMRTLNKSGKSFSYTGLDIDNYAISKGNEALRSTEFENIDFTGLEHGQIDSIPFPDNSFDISICLNVLEHVSNPLPGISELIRATKRLILIRTLLSDQTFVIKESRNLEQLGLGYKHLQLPSPKNEIDFSGEPKVFVYQNIYGKSFLSENLAANESIRRYEIFEDKMWDENAYQKDSSVNNLFRRTEIINGAQIRGNFIDTNFWILIQK